MKRKHLVVCLLATVLLNTLWAQRVTVGVGASSDCILVLEGTDAFLSRHGEGLHALIDLLPADRALGLMVTGQSNKVQEPALLSRLRRAELHAYIEQCYPAASVVAPEEWETPLAAAISLLASRGGANSTVVLLRAGTPLPDNWQEQVQWAAEQGVRLYELDLDVPWSSTGIEPRLPRALASGGLASLLELLGLAPAPLTSLAFNDIGMQLALTVPVEVESLILQWDRSSAHSVLLTTPTGELVDPTLDDFQSRLFEGPSYTCLHLAPELLPTVSTWSGQWVISASGPIGVTVWYDDPAWLQAWVRETPSGQRLVCLATNLGAESKPTKVTLEDVRGKTLLQLNDLGINGDALANDGVYSAHLPSFVLAGPAVIRLTGKSERLLLVDIPPAASVVVPLPDEKAEKAFDKLLLVGLVLTVSGAVMIPGPRRKLPVWRVSHQSVDGHWHCYDLKEPMLTAGSAVGCQIRLARAAAGEQLRIKVTRDDQLRLDVLASQPPVCVNDRQVYLCKVLEHGDQITIGGDRLFIEKIKYLRVGKGSAGQGNGVPAKK